MSDPNMILGIKKTVTLPVMAKARIGHFVEAQVLQALEVDYIDESEVLTIAGASAALSSDCPIVVVTSRLYATELSD